MAQFTEDLVWSSTVSSTGVSNWERTTISDDSRASFATVTSGSNGLIIFELTNLSLTPSSIVSVQMRHEANAAATDTVVIGAEMLNNSNDVINVENTGFSTTSDNLKTNMTTHTTNALTSNAWTLNDINNLRIKLGYRAESGTVGDSYVDHFYVRVTYDMQRLIKLDSGKIKLDSGKIKIVEE